MKFHSIEELLADIREGKMVLLVDDEDRENEGDLVLAADYVTPTAINFMASQARGLICLAMTGAQIDRLRLPPMVSEEFNHSPNKTAFTVSIEAATGVSTGISTADRAHTVRVAANPSAKPSDIHMPGHIFPIRAKEGGVLKRAGHTEGSIDLVKLAGLNPAAVICEVMNADGSMARVPDLMTFAEKHEIKIGTIVELMEYRLQREILVEEVHAVKLPGLPENWQARVFRSRVDSIEHLVLQKGTVNGDEPLLVRVQSESPTKDLFAPLYGFDNTLQVALQRLDLEKSAALVLLRGSSANRKLINEVKMFCGEMPQLEMDALEYGIGAQILHLIGARKIRVLTNRTEHRAGLKAFELELVENVPFQSSSRENNDKEKNAKQDSLHH